MDSLKPGCLGESAPEAAADAVVWVALARRSLWNERSSTIAGRKRPKLLLQWHGNKRRACAAVQSSNGQFWISGEPFRWSSQEPGDLAS
ncbi:hypothetical protein SS05631_b50680 (plasmid) [Sinorhizobium sp. CCBAU 05631]|nr:hypothetical protein SS05631_b50680 [Sinorhizobium sp. CCBAU 05631]